ncbi:MAG TPA: nitrate reductase molybdenum cofactor assembly chaperone [Solirubrobacterales bacterium]|nr:nitrate reductase molybdenum cofactor assembly chaperone [Solirubrobacterales bacterium]
MPAPHNRSHPGAATLRVLAALLAYPDARLRGHASGMAAALAADDVLSASRRAEIEALARSLSGADPIEAESAYVETFDRGRATSLYLFEHVHGDSRDRGPAMIDLAQTYEQAGLYLAPGELPDYLPVVLEFVSTQPPRVAKAFLGEVAHLVNAIFGALLERGSPYACVLGALLDLAGEKARAVEMKPEPSLDESWAEPAAFDGCAGEGQARPGAPQPIRIVRNARHTTQGIKS